MQTVTDRGLNLVAIGGGTGLSTLLGGLKRLVGKPAEEAVWFETLSAIVTVSDDGGSSGRLREELQMLLLDPDPSIRKVACTALRKNYPEPEAHCDSRTE